MTKDLVETWNGSVWSIQSSPAEGNDSNAMRGVSCASATSCISVGELSSKPAAERWNGSEWSLMSPPNPTGAVAASLESVSCPSTTSCVAVGHSHESGKQNVTLAEAWNGTSWSLQSSPNPSENEGGSVLLSVSCLSSTSCFAVGDGSKKIFTMQTLAESWNGSAWTLQSSPNPTGATRSTLLADSCSSSIECTAVGSGSPGPSGETTVTLAERWNGTEWSTQTTPNPPPHTEDVVTGVGCVASANCVAVGKNSYTEAGFVEAWNGAEWKIISELNGYSGSFVGISCGSTTSCMTVGKRENSNELRSNKVKYIEAFHVWQTESESIPAPSVGSEVKLTAVSCSSSTFCMAVGSYLSEVGTKDLVETWNGSVWSIQSSPAEGNDSNAMRGVSCASATSCISVGELSSKPAAERWNGSEWSLMSPPNPTGAVAAELESVSCPSTTSCVAVGHSHESGKQNVTLAEAWNGTSWSLQSSPNPSENEGGSVLLSVSCLSSTSCFAVGDGSKKIFTMQTLAESWNGSAWTLQTTPNPTGATKSTLLADSCSSSIECTAVGSGTPGPSGETTVTLAERYE